MRARSTAPSARAQLSEWRVLVTDAVERCVRVAPTRTQLVLRSDFDGLSALALLTQLETRGCAIFRFTFEVTATNIVLAVEVPAEASPVRQSFIDEITVGIEQVVGHAALPVGRGGVPGVMTDRNCCRFPIFWGFRAKIALAKLRFF